MWKDKVDRWVNSKQKMAGSKATPELTNHYVLDEEEGLPSPPPGDLAFFNPHSMSLALRSFLMAWIIMEILKKVQH